MQKTNIYINQEVEKDYVNDLKKIKDTITENQNKAMVVVNSAMILTYYQIGTIINERKEWGNKYVQKLSIDLKEFGSGYSYVQLMRMAQFAKIYTSDEIVSQPVIEIPWGTIIHIMNKSSSKEEILWYINQTYKNRWSRSTVIKQFELKAYQRNLIEPLTSVDTIENDLIKDTLVFPFITKNDLTNESSFKNKLIDNIILFLQELGPGFALVGKEYRINTPTEKNFYIDLLMYHTKVHAYVVIEVKLNEVEPSDFGQLNFYVNAINDLEKTDTDNETVGILLCKSTDKYVVETSLKRIKTPLEFLNTKYFEELPNYLASKVTYSHHLEKWGLLAR